MGERRRDRSWTMQVTALYDYEPEQSDELEFQEGDVLRVVHVQDDGWWSGYNTENPDVVGLFPSNYVQAQRATAPAPNNKIVVDVGTTPRPPESSRQRIQQQQRAPDTPELEDESEDDDKAHEMRGEHRGHIGTVLQLRKHLEEAERASEAARDARRQAEREKLRHRSSWRERQQDEEDLEEDEMNQERILNHKQVARGRQPESPLQDGDDTEDEDESAYPQRQGFMHENDQVGGDQPPGDDRESEQQNEMGQEQAVEVANVENAAATMIAKGFRRHAAAVQSIREREREAEQQKLGEIAAVCIQRWAAHAHSRQRTRRQLQHERNTARQHQEQRNEAATSIQRWIRLRWASFWRRQVQRERERRSVRDAQRTRQREEGTRSEHDQTEVEEKQRQDAEKEEEPRRLAAEEEEHRQLEREAEAVQQKLDDEDQKRQLQLTAVEEEVHRRFLQADVHEEEHYHEVGPAVPPHSTQSPSPDRPRRKVMKKEAVELIKTLVQQQLGETLREHDAKMDELQRMVARLQTVVRKQTAMLQDSTDQLVGLQAKQKDQRPSIPPRSNDAGNGSFLPKIGAQSSIPRQPAVPSGLRAPRPVVLSKLPVLASSGKEASCNQLRKAP